MPQIAQLIGGAGTAKTTELLNILEKVLSHLGDPRRVGYSSFTRAARREAAARACSRFGLAPHELEVEGWFRTIHSIAYRCLGAGDDLIAGSKEDRQWLADALQDESAALAFSRDEQELTDPFKDQQSDAARALAVWDAARQRLATFRAAWQKADGADGDLPPFDYCRQVVARYEQAKRLDRRSDFTDLLARFAGWRFHLEGSPERCDPEGVCPQLHTWIFDEQQDASPLLHSCCERLVAAPSVEWVYLAGDPFQSIYGFAGADHRCFLDGWPLAKKRVMPQSYRCPRPILELGERILAECSDYFDRHVAPARHEGAVEELGFSPGNEDCEELLDRLDPRESWLLVARTNFQARRLGRVLDGRGIPWLSTRGVNRWAAPVRNTAIRALLNVEAGGPIDGGEWQAVLKQISSRVRCVEMLARGTKARFDRMTEDAAREQFAWIMPDDLPRLGATPALLEAIRGRRWRSWIENAESYDQAQRRWGAEGVESPQIRVGTIHSVKGAEADNVALLTTISGPCFRAAETPEGCDEEKRCAYVGVTRARRRLIVLDEFRVPYRWRLPL